MIAKEKLIALGFRHRLLNGVIPEYWISIDDPAQDEVCIDATRLVVRYGETKMEPVKCWLVMPSYMFPLVHIKTVEQIEQLYELLLGNQPQQRARGSVGGGMRLLDLYCGAGGSAVGYHRAGFEIVGVDNVKQRKFPFEFHQADALEFLSDHWQEFDAVHASPPCQAYSISRNNGCHKDAPRLIGSTRDLILKTRLPYVIENVMGAPLRNPIMLCGASFGLGASGFDLARHRLFESNILLLSLPCTHRRGFTIGVYGNGTNSWHRKKFGRCVTADECREAMDIDWMSRRELTQAIPPPYTEFIGKQLMAALTNNMSGLDKS